MLSAFRDMHPKDEQDQTGVIHNDVNPNNILLDTGITRGTLIDFGAASPVGPITFRGTYGYISADLLENGEIDAQPKGDLFGLAVTLWEWVTGRRPPADINLDKETFPELAGWQRSALAEWFAKGLDSGTL
jgi:serine/threonine protein kinase